MKALTRRQAQILQAVADGKSNKEIARRFGIRPHSVKNHLDVVYAHLGVHNRLRAAVVAWTWGLIR